LSKSVSDVPALDLGDVVAAPIRATNYTRSVFHLGSALFALGLMHLLPGRAWLVGVSAAFAVSGWTMEIARRRSVAVNERLMALFSPVAHPHERHRVNSSTWYVSALLVLALFAPVRAAEVGVLVLGVADPAAGLIGRRFGRTRLIAGRSLEGSIGFVVAGALAAGGWLAVTGPLPLPSLAIVAFAGAVTGALAELGSTRLDDNFTIPVSVTAAVAAAQMLVGG
jgi:dolichol kinase